MSVDVHTVVATPFLLHHHLINTHNNDDDTEGMGMVQGLGHVIQCVLGHMYVFSFFYLIFSSLLTTFMFITRYDNEIKYSNNNIWQWWQQHRGNGVVQGPRHIKWHVLDHWCVFFFLFHLILLLTNLFITRYYTMTTHTTTHTTTTTYNHHHVPHVWQWQLQHIGQPYWSTFKHILRQKSRSISHKFI